MRPANTHTESRPHGGKLSAGGARERSAAMCWPRRSGTRLLRKRLLAYSERRGYHPTWVVYLRPLRWRSRMAEKNESSGSRSVHVGGNAGAIATGDFSTAIAHQEVESGSAAQMAPLVEAIGRVLSG